MDNKQVYVKMFGFFDVLYKDKTIFLENAANLKSLMLLKFLIVNKNKEYLPEVIADNVWPENDYFDSKKVVRTYIHRLRKILSQANRYKYNFGYDIRILNIKGSYKLELSDNVELETELFESYCHKAEKEQSPEELKSLFDDIIRVYQNDFMQDSPFEQWVIMYRNYYRRNFVKAVNTILKRFEEIGDFNTIVEMCENSFKVYDLDEAMNVTFMNALASTGRSNDAMAHYNFFTDKLYSELSIQPSDKLRELFDKIKNLSGSDDFSPSGGARGSQLDERKIRDIIDDAIKCYPFTSVPNYAIGYVRITDNDVNNMTDDFSDEILKTPMECLKESLNYALRKNDMYSFFGEDVAIVILAGAHKDFYYNISTRIVEDFHKRYGGFGKKVLIDFLPANIHD